MKRIARCQHIKINRTQCGSPAMRGRRLCYFHLHISALPAFTMGEHRNSSPYTIPLLEDAESIQIALMRVTELILTQCIDNKRAGLMLYALQTAASNIGRVAFQPRSSAVVISKAMTRDTPLNEDPLDELMFGPDDEEYEEYDDEQEGDTKATQEDEQNGEEPNEEANQELNKTEWLAEILPAGTRPS
jgi:hypothetical protein